MHLTEMILQKKPWQRAFFALHNNTGLCMRSNEDAVVFAKLFIQAMVHSTQLCTWDLASVFPVTYSLAAKLNCVDARALDLFHHAQSPEYELAKLYEGKTILVLLSHEATFNQQIRHYDRLFPTGKAPFRNATFVHLRPPQQHAGQTDGASWRVHFDEFKARIDATFRENPSIELVLAACGGMGMPVCDYIFTEHKTSVIYAGGSLQLTFGIDGGRWRSDARVAAVRNELWTSPLPEDVPPHADRVENACYW
jgi:hypothetical protein